MLTLLRPLHPLATRWGLALAVAASLLATPAAHAALTANADGTVTDSTTNLVWDQCAYGLTGSTCASGSAFYGDWPSALAQASAANTAVYKGFSDWRMPNKNELESIVKIDAQAPAIDATAFPSTPTSDWFWTSTTFAVNPADAWIVFFDAGWSVAYGKDFNGFVRLVRSGQSFAPFDGLLPVVNGSCGSAHAATPLVTSAPSANLCGLGSTASSVVAGNSAYTWSCAGSNGGSTASCSAGRGYTVTPNPGTGGTLSPSGAQVVAYNATPSFTATASSGYTLSGVSGCNGALSGSTYTTGAITADCAVNASFTLNTSYSGGAPTGSGTVGTVISGGPTCGFASVGYQTAESVAPLPAGYSFPHGVLAFTTNTCTTGGTVTVTLTYPQALPANAKFYKYGPPAVGQPNQWYEHPATIADNTVTYSVTDGAMGDSNGAPGVIADPAGAAVPGAATATAIPTLSEWAMALLAGLMGWVAVVSQRRRHGG